MNYRSSTNPNPADFSTALHHNFKELNNLPIFDISFLDKNEDWYLLSFLREQERNGHTSEITIAALNSVVGTLSEGSYYFNAVTNRVGYLNQNHHLLGESASNKSSVCHEISTALQSVMNIYPGRYSSTSDDHNNNNPDESSNCNTNNKKTKSNIEQYCLMVSNITEVGLVNNLAKTDTLLIHPDGDVALGKLGYYDQSKNDTSAGVSLFCDASDGIRGGYIRGTGVSQIKVDRPVSLFNMFIASTGTKLSFMLQRFYEKMDQDGVFGRVFYTWSPTITELPKTKVNRFTKIASYSHFACSVAHFFNNAIEFRYTANRSDFLSSLESLETEERLIQEAEKQNVSTPHTYSNVLDMNDVHEIDGDGEQMSSFKLLKVLLDDWWKTSNTVEHHLRSIHRKVVFMLSKCIWTLKIIRIIFRLMSTNLSTIDQKEGDPSSINSTGINSAFHQSMKSTIQNYLEDEAQQMEKSKWILRSNHDDIMVGYRWYCRKILVADTLLSLKSLPELVFERTGKKQTDKTPHEIKLEKAMAKVMNLPVVFITRKYLTSNKQGSGSGQFSHTYDLKPEQILPPLLDSGLLIGGNFIKNARPLSDDITYSSFCKQLPSVICNNPRIKQSFDNLGLSMSHYEKTFEHQHLPLGNEFTKEAIEFLKNTDEFVQYYHNYYQEGRHYQEFKDMVNERVNLREIIRDEDQFQSSGNSFTDNHQSNTSCIRDFCEANDVHFDFESLSKTTNPVTTASHAVSNSRNTLPSPSKNVSPNHQYPRVTSSSPHVFLNSTPPFDQEQTRLFSTLPRAHSSGTLPIDQEQTRLPSSLPRALSCTTSTYVNVIKDLTNNFETRGTDSDGRVIQQTKRRGRPSSTNTTAQKWTIEMVDDLIVNPKPVVWKSIIINRQFLLGTTTDLFKMIPSRQFNEQCRWKLIDFLITKKILVQGEWFSDAKGTSIAGYIKGSPANPDVSLSLAYFGLDIEEYKSSLNPNHDAMRLIDGKTVTQSCFFSHQLQNLIENDEWFKQNLQLDKRLIFSTTELLQTTSNYRIDEFQKQRQEKVQKAIKNKRKHVEELQQETSAICGTDLAAKRRRKPKTYDD